MRRPPPSKRRGSKTELSPAARALRLLARREHTRVELERKLAPHVADSAELAALLDDLTVSGSLSDGRAVEQLVHAKRSRYGAARIRQALVERGVSKELIAPALAALEGTEVERARSVWSRKFRVAPSSASERARQVRFLQSRGFSIDVALRVVRGGDEN